MDIASLTIGEDQIKFEKPAFPESVSLAWNSAFPVLQVKATLRGAFRLCDKTKWVVATPLLSKETIRVSAGQGYGANDARNRGIRWTKIVRTALLEDGSGTMTSRVVLSG